MLVDVVGIHALRPRIVYSAMQVNAMASLPRAIDQHVVARRWEVVHQLTGARASLPLTKRSMLTSPPESCWVPKGSKRSKPHQLDGQQGFCAQLASPTFLRTLSAPRSHERRVVHEDAPAEGWHASGSLMTRLKL